MTKPAKEEPKKKPVDLKKKGLEEDDAFEDFPTNIAATSTAGITASSNPDVLNQWDDTWEDDDTAEDFSIQLKYLKLVCRYYKSYLVTNVLLLSTNSY